MFPVVVSPLPAAPVTRATPGNSTGGPNVTEDNDILLLLEWTSKTSEKLSQCIQRHISKVPLLYVFGNAWKLRKWSLATLARQAVLLASSANRRREINALFLARNAFSVGLFEGPLGHAAAVLGAKVHNGRPARSCLEVYIILLTFLALSSCVVRCMFTKLA
jgi:hypothetical protein